MQTQPGREQQWLSRLVGEWTYEMEAEAEPGEPPIRDTGTEHVRSLGGVWAICEATGHMPDGQEAVSIMSIGYDSVRERFHGTFISSMMTYLWIYEGQLDEGGTMLTIDAEGPSYTDEGQTALYRDTIEIVGDDHRVQTSSCRRDDGTWHQFMTTHFRRVKQNR